MDTKVDYRKRLMDTLLFKDTKNVPFIEIALWGQTLERWQNEGLKIDELKNGGWFMEGEPFFGFEPREYIKINAIGPLPILDYNVLEEDDRIIVYIDSMGVTHKALKEGQAKNGTRLSMDQYIDFPVKDRATFESYKKRYMPDVHARYPQQWDEKKQRWNEGNIPVGLTDNGEFGFYSMLRRWMGVEGVSYIFYDDPVLAHEMLNFLCDYMMELTEKAVKEVRIDFFNFFEDMSFKNGPLVSPEIFREFFLPVYKKFIDHLRRHGIKLIMVDTDGDPTKLVPLFIEAGVNCIWPIEVAAGVDPIIFRKKFGKDISMIGGIDKRVLTMSKDDIRKEVERICNYMLPQGGYIPTVDHAVPPDVPYENFLYYLDIKKKALEGKL